MFVISKINSIFLSLQYECVNLQNHVMITLVDIEKNNKTDLCQRQ